MRKNLILAAAAALALSATDAPAETLGDPAAWDAQLQQCRLDPSHVERVVEAPGFQWLNECTVSRAPFRYRMVTVTRWFVPIDQSSAFSQEVWRPVETIGTDTSLASPTTG